MTEPTDAERRLNEQKRQFRLSQLEAAEALSWAIIDLVRQFTAVDEKGKEKIQQLAEELL